MPQPGGPGEPDDGTEGGEPMSPGRFSVPGFDLSQVDLAQVMQMLRTQGPVNWEVARQVAVVVAREGDPSPEPPVPREDARQLEELASAAETLVAQESGLAAALGVPRAAIGRTGWAELHLDALRPVLEALATRLRGTLEQNEPESGKTGPLGSPGSGQGADPFAGMLAMMAPVLLGVQAGSMIGFLAQHALGRYDLPLPTSDRPTLAFVAPNLEAFAKAWSLPDEDLRFAVAIHEAVRAAQRSVGWVQDRLVRLAVEYVSEYALDPDVFEEQFGDVDPRDPESLAAVAERPDALLGAMQSETQRAVLRQVQGLTMVLEGHAALVLERIGERMIPEFGRLSEAMRRHHVERGEAGRFVEGLLGLRLDREHYEQGEAFCRGVVERAGLEGLGRVLSSERLLPTPAELEAPGLWLARIDLPDLHEPGT